MMRGCCGLVGGVYFKVGAVSVRLKARLIAQVGWSRLWVRRNQST